MELCKNQLLLLVGGFLGRINEDGTQDPYETKLIDEEIIRLTNKERPNALLLAHALPNSSIENMAYNTFINNYVNRYNCETKILFKNELKEDQEEIKKFIDWADIIYETGGNTLDMITVWKNTDFDKLLKYAYEKGKILCGISAGANCWFKSCLSDSLRLINGDQEPLIEVECLGFINALFVSHADEEKINVTKEILKDSDKVALLFPNGLALEIINDKYRIIGESDIPAYKIYYKNGICHEEVIEQVNEFKELSTIL